MAAMKPEAEYFSDMPSRMYSIALFSQLFTQMHEKMRTLRDFGLETIDQQVTFLFYVLRFLMEKTLRSEPCTIEDIAFAIQEICSRYFRIPVYEEAMKLARVVVDQILYNNSEPIEFIPYKENSAHNQYLKYITSSLEKDETGRYISYRMSEDGFHLMLSTLEMEQNMRIRIQDLIFEMEMQKKNYSKALDEIRRLFQLLRIREIDIQEKTAQIRSSAVSLAPEEYQALYQDNFEIMDQTRNKFAQYEKQVEGSINELNRRIHTVNFSEKELGNLSNLLQISALLKQSILAFTSIVTTLNNFSKDYQKELEEQMLCSSPRMYPWQKMVMDPVFNQPDLLASIDSFLHPLFFDQPQPIFLPASAFDFRKNRVMEESALVELADEQADEALLAALKEKQLRHKAHLDAVLSALLDALDQSDSRQTTLSGLLQSRPALFADLDTAREFLSAWSSSVRIDLDALRQDAGELVFEDLDSYNHLLSLLMFMPQYPFLEYYQALRIDKAGGRTQFQTVQDDLEMTVTADDLRFTLEGK